MALKLQSRDGRITPTGIRAVRQAVLTGENVHRADVLAIITAYVDARREADQLVSGGAR